MKAYLKIGNSQTVLVRESHRTALRFDTSSVRVSEMKKHLKAVHELWVVSVVPSLSLKLKKSFQQIWNEIEISDLDVRFAYRKGLGLDRKLNLYAAKNLFRTSKPLLVIDMGTAITVDLMDQRKRHRGGWILPGPSVSFRALHEQTALLPLAKIREQDQKISFGRSTRECLAVGQIQFLHATILQAKHQAKEVFGESPKIILTGGWSNLINFEKIWVKPELWKEAIRHFVGCRY